MYKLQLIQGDCLDKLKELADNSVDSIVTDPPYELGFMGKSWDSTGIANNSEMWAECLRVLKPGGYLLSFGGTRTYHRMACAIEDAGFEIKNMLEWIFASGFPKSQNIGKMYDKKMGNEREWISESPFKASEEAELATQGKSQTGRTTHPDITKGTSPYEGLGTSLKPAHEPIIWASKPLTTVPDRSILEVDLLLNLLLCQTLNVKYAEKFLELNQAEQTQQDFVQWIVNEWNIQRKKEKLEKMDIFKSQEMEIIS